MKLTDIDQVKRWVAQFERATAIRKEIEFLSARNKEIEGGNKIRASDGVVGDAGKFVIEGRDRQGKTLKLNLTFLHVESFATDLMVEARDELEQLGVEIEG